MYLVSRTKTFAKLFFIISFTGVLMYSVLGFYFIYVGFSGVSQMSRYQVRIGRLTKSFLQITDDTDLKYILIWTTDNNDPHKTRQSEIPLFNLECPKVSCYITTNKTILNGNYTNFDAIVFNQSKIDTWASKYLPQQRLPHQKYVFYSKLPAKNHPVCSTTLNNYFNWTWTYRLKSNIFSPFIEVKDFDGNIVAPKFNVSWREKKAAFEKPLKDPGEVKTKTKAVSWIPVDCELYNNPNVLSIEMLKQSLLDQNLHLDIYGCGFLECPKEGCLAAVKRDYYFYLAFESIASEDYVTEEVLKAYNQDAVPIVVGGANYSKFLPANSYILFDGSEEKVAIQVAFAINNPSIYYGYFQWKELYTIQKVDDKKGSCKLCSLLHNKKMSEISSVAQNFRKWWYGGPLADVCFPKGAESISAISTINNSNNYENSN